MKSFVLPELSASPATKTGMVAAPSLPASTSTQPATELAQFWGPPRLLDNLAGPFNTLEGARDAGRAWVDEYEQGTEGGYGYVSLLVSTESNTTWGETRTTYYASEPIQSDQRFTELSRQGLQKVINDVYGYDTYKYEGLDPGSE
jgi:hypothetical protein